MSWLRKSLLPIGLALAMIGGFLPFSANADELLPVTTPSVTSVDGNAVELGLKFQSSVPIKVTGVQFFKGPGNGGTHTGTLWSSTGTKLTTVTLANEAPYGWQYAKFPTPVDITANTTYVISYYAPQGHYAVDVGYFATERKSGALTALKSGGVYKYGPVSAFPNATFKDSNYWVDVVTDLSPLTPPPPTATVTPAGCPGAKHQLDGDDGKGGCWPGPSNTGVPPGTTLTNYTGPTIITTPNTVIDKNLINVRLQIRAPNVKITNSRLNEPPFADSRWGPMSLTVEDSEILTTSDISPGIGYDNLTVRRTEVKGGEDGIMCTTNCIIEDSWIHDQLLGPTKGSHTDGFQNSGGAHNVLRHNVWTCTPLPNGHGGGCTADVSFFGDWAQISDVVFDHNLLISTAGSYCAYFGATPHKPYPLPNDVRVTNNVFKRGANGKCGFYGPATAYHQEPGSVWSGNVWDDGAVIEP